MSNDIPKFNNFDIIRLVAAIQVLIYHSITHLHLDYNNIIKSLLSYFPGVPIFFFVSGFLISLSFSKNPNIVNYFSNRALRLYPGLITCLFISLISVFIAGYLSPSIIFELKFWTWIFSQVTFFQFFNPDFMRNYGVGVLNGSLWTIVVEMQFYVVTPLILNTLKNRPSFFINIFLLTIIFLSLLVNLLHGYLEDTYGGYTAHKLIGVSFLPWLYMYATGILFQINYKYIYKNLSKFSELIFLSYIPIIYILSHVLNFNLGNNLNPIIFFILSILIFTSAFTFKNLSYALLKGTDISYGIYIYHMPVINLLIYYNIGQPYNILICIFSIILISIISWRTVEKPFLKMKRKSIHLVN